MLLRSFTAFSWRMRCIEYFAADNIMRYFAALDECVGKSNKSQIRFATWYAL